ncbi:MAG: hypothetical protein ACRD1R_00440, partial [Acidobacteriota bacterium]
HLLRILGLEGTERARAQCATIRQKLLKIGAQVRISVRRVLIAPPAVILTSNFSPGFITSGRQRLVSRENHWGVQIRPDRV